MGDFTPIHAVIGGALIALGLGLSLLATGRTVGLSGVFSGVLGGPRAAPADWAWRVWFLVGMIATGVVFAWLAPWTFEHEPAPAADGGTFLGLFSRPTGHLSLWLVAVSGLLVGAGTRLANGCTSGHGLCGISRMSKRSIVATCVFFAAGVATATLIGPGAAGGRG